MARGDDSIDIGKTARFAAFISYSHADAAVAAKLQRKLERYRLPKHIVETHDRAAAGLGQIFRDREDLAAAASLSNAIRNAIADAEALIVVCSPDAKASEWVSAEIALFRELHPDRPVLAAIVRGEPAEAFPAALTENGREPLAADLRPGGDGGSLGFLKIVAGIASVPLDTLVQRDAQRRVRRVMWITGAALAAMLIMGIMTTLALSARNEAARQRASAEGLVEYMLTDLREKLKGVGRIEIMEGVNRRAMDHYSQQGDLNRLPADSLERRARILHAMGEDDDREGKLDQALAKFKEAHRVTATLLTKEKTSPDRIFAHGQSEYWVGFAAWRQKDIETTRTYWSGYLQQANALAKVEPKTVRSLMELGYAHGNLCELFANQKIDIPRGVGHCRESIAFERQAVEREPENVPNAMALANRLGFMADALGFSNDHEGAIEHRLQEQKLIDSLLARDPKNFELRERQTWPMIGLGWAEYSRGNYRGALRPLRTAINRLVLLKREYPDDQTLDVVQVRALIMLAMTLSKQGNQEWIKQRSRAEDVAKNASKLGNTPNNKRIREILGKFDREK
jgi:tetratricopeptide (TPR) repeat protein